MSNSDRIFTTIDRDILEDYRVLGICLVNNKRCIVPLWQYMEDYKAIARRAESIINSAFDYVYVDRESRNPFGIRSF